LPITVSSCKTTEKELIDSFQKGVSISDEEMCEIHMLGFQIPYRPINTDSVARYRWYMLNRPYYMLGLALVGIMLCASASTVWGFANGYWEYKKKMWVCTGLYEMRDTIVKTKAEAREICERIVNDPRPNLDD
jgi:hypothetical protein